MAEIYCAVFSIWPELCRWPFCLQRGRSMSLVTWDPKSTKVIPSKKLSQWLTWILN